MAMPDAVELLVWLDTYDPELVAMAEAHFGFDLERLLEERPDSAGPPTDKPDPEERF
jgi:hypothetical protein